MELEYLASMLGSAWKKLGRRLKIDEQELDDIDQAHKDLWGKGFKMLLCWKMCNGPAATYEILGDALQHGLVHRRDLARKFCFE